MAMYTQLTKRGLHKSEYKCSDFFCGEFADMVKKGQWVVLPFDEVYHESHSSPFNLLSGALWSVK